MKKILRRNTVSLIVLLTVGVVFGSTKAKGDASKLYFSKGGSCIQIASILTTVALTTGGLGAQLYLNTSGGIGSFAIFSTSNCSPSSAVHFHA